MAFVLRRQWSGQEDEYKHVRVSEPGGEHAHKLVRILKLVIPAKAGIHWALVNMDSRVRGNDERSSKPGFRMDTS